MIDPGRAALEALIAGSGEDYAGLSRLIGRNPAYIQQYVKRGTPKRLTEHDRGLLARYFGVAEAVLGGPSDPSPRVVPASAGRQATRVADYVVVPRHAACASADDGALGDDGRAAGGLPFPPRELARLGATDPAALSLIRVVGDSMHPTLDDGDELLVDRADGPERLRDGLYVLRLDGALLVKRLAPRPGGGLQVLSDNPRYPPLTLADRSEVAIVGRAIWAGRRLR